MYESKENLKHYAILIKADFTSFIDNKNIDGGDFVQEKVYNDLGTQPYQLRFDNRKNAKNGADPDRIWEQNKYKEQEPFNNDNYTIPATPLRAKIALEVFKHLTDFFSSNSYSREMDYS